MSMLRNVTGGGCSKLVISTLSATLGVEKFLPCHCDEVGTLSCQREGKSVFTLSEVKGKTPLLKIRRGVGVRSKKAAFTLAEVLITLGIIGVVAAVTMPTVIANINERVNSERHANIALKVTQAMEQMRAHGLLNNSYETTESFVDELQKYLKIAKRCDSSHIADCWPTQTVTDSNGEEFEVSKAKTGKNLSLTTTTNNVGLVLADGASMILNYDPSDVFTLDVGEPVSAYKKMLPIGGGKEKEFAYSTSVTGSIDFVTDVNGAKGPNKEKSDKYYDIRNLRGANFSNGCTGEEIDGVGCVAMILPDMWAFAYGKECEKRNLTSADEAAVKNLLNIDKYRNKSYWVGAPTTAVGNGRYCWYDYGSYKVSCKSRKYDNYLNIVCLQN